MYFLKDNFLKFHKYPTLLKELNIIILFAFKPSNKFNIKNLMKQLKIWRWYVWFGQFVVVIYFPAALHVTLRVLLVTVQMQHNVFIAKTTSFHLKVKKSSLLNKPKNNLFFYTNYLGTCLNNCPIGFYGDKKRKVCILFN